MIQKPPLGFPRSCWNIYDGKPKKQYDTLKEAELVAQGKPSYQGYFCGFCKRFHIGRITIKIPRNFNRKPELEIELGSRVIAHFHMGDGVEAIKKRFKTAQDMHFRRTRPNND